MSDIYQLVTSNEETGLVFRSYIKFIDEVTKNDQITEDNLCLLRRRTLKLFEGYSKLAGKYFTMKGFAHSEIKIIDAGSCDFLNPDPTTICISHFFSRERMNDIPLPLTIIYQVGIDGDVAKSTDVELGVNGRGILFKEDENYKLRMQSYDNEEKIESTFDSIMKKAELDYETANKTYIIKTRKAMFEEELQSVKEDFARDELSF